MRKITAIIFLSALLCGGCGGSSSGSVQFEPKQGNSPTEPYISAPDGTVKLEMRLFQLTTSVDKPEPEMIESVDYEEGVVLEINDVPPGPWVMRVNALDASKKVLAYAQEGINVTKGSVKFSSWFLPGTAPSGYIYTADLGSRSLSRICLFDDKVVNIPLQDAPVSLFLKSGREGVMGDTVYATTGGPKILSMELSLFDNSCDTTDVYFPSGGTFSRSDNGMAAVTFYQNDGVHFFNADTEEYSDLIFTGKGADRLSNVVDGKLYVSNKGARSITKLNLAAQKAEGSSKGIGCVPDYLALNSSGTRVWMCGTDDGNSNPFVRVVDNSGDEIGHFGAQLSVPSAIIIDNGIVCVADNGRKELIFFHESDELENDFERLNLTGGGDDLWSDGQRLYCMSSETDQVFVVDWNSQKLIKTIKVGQTPHSMVYLDYDPEDSQESDASDDSSES
ncbi:MAG: hypothetical protein K6G50_02505 [bacterium]|nr:hypothetical protein [bacterium]